MQIAPKECFTDHQLRMREKDEISAFPRMKGEKKNQGDDDDHDQHWNGEETSFDWRKKRREEKRSHRWKKWICCFAISFVDWDFVLNLGNERTNCSAVLLERSSRPIDRHVEWVCPRWLWECSSCRWHRFSRQSIAFASDFLLNCSSETNAKTQQKISRWTSIFVYQSEVRRSTNEK